jgi:hypothetical protein
MCRGLLSQTLATSHIKLEPDSLRENSSARSTASQSSLSFVSPASTSYLKTRLQQQVDVSSERYNTPYHQNATGQPRLTTGTHAGRLEAGIPLQILTEPTHQDHYLDELPWLEAESPQV